MGNSLTDIPHTKCDLILKVNSKHLCYDQFQLLKPFGGLFEKRKQTAQSKQTADFIKNSKISFQTLICDFCCHTVRGGLIFRGRKEKVPLIDLHAPPQGRGQGIVRGVICLTVVFPLREELVRAASTNGARILVLGLVKRPGRARPNRLSKSTLEFH